MHFISKLKDDFNLQKRSVNPKFITIAVLLIFINILNTVILQTKCRFVAVKNRIWSQAKFKTPCDTKSFMNNSKG